MFVCVCAKVIHLGIFFLIAERSNLVQVMGNSSIFQYAGYFPASHTVSAGDTPQVEMALARSSIISVGKYRLPL